MDAETIRKLIESGLPGARADVQGDDGVHFEATVVAEAFSNQVITPGKTTTDDVSWYIRNRFDALGLPVFWALASETAVDIVGPDYAGRAIAKIGFGIVCATVFGIPVGTLISDAFGWRSAFAVLAVIALAKALLLGSCPHWATVSIMGLST